MGYAYRDETEPYFIYTMYPIQTVLQRRQRQIESNPNNFTVQYAVQYYSMWNFDAFQTAYRIFEDYFWNAEEVMRVLFGTTA